MYANEGCASPLPIPSAFCLAESIRFTFVQGGGEGGSREIGGKPSGCQVGWPAQNGESPIASNSLNNWKTSIALTHPKSIYMCSLKTSSFERRIPGYPDSPPVESHFPGGLSGHTDIVTSAQLICHVLPEPLMDFPWVCWPKLGNVDLN